MKKFVFAAVLAALSLVACKPAAAADYTYVGAAYTTANVEDSSADAFLVKGSYALNDLVFLEASYKNGFNSDVALDAGTVKFGVGLRTAILKNMDLYGTLSSSVVVDDVRDGDKYSYEVEGGVRAQATDRLEVRAGAVAFERDGIRYGGKIGAEYAVTKNIRLGADVLAKDGASEAQLGARWYF